MTALFVSYFATSKDGKANIHGFRVFGGRKAPRDANEVIQLVEAIVSSGPFSEDVIPIWWSELHSSPDKDPTR